MSLHSFLHRGDAPAAPKRITIRRRLLGRGSRLRSMSMAAGLLSLGLASFQPAHAGTITWDGVPADWFTAPSHWSNGATPLATDDAQNLTTAAMTLGQSTTVNSFLSNGAFTFNGGTFTGNKANAASTLQVNNIFTLSGGQISNFTINQGTGGSVVVTTNGGNALSNTTVNASLDLASTGNGYLQLLNTNTINGAISLGAGGGNGLHLFNVASNLVLGSTGTLTGFGSVVQDNSGATITNNGLINANSASGLTLGVTNFTNSAGATTEATAGPTTSGILNLSNTTTTNDGLLAATGGGVLNLSAATTLQSNADGHINSVGGTVNVMGATLLGTINGVGASTLVFTTDARNNFNGTTANINLDLASTGNGYLQLLNANTINGAISLGAGGGNGLHLFNVASNLTLNGTLTGYGALVQDNAGATVTSNGLINANSGGNTLNINTTNFNNTGTTQVTNGATLNVTSTNATNSGVVNVQGGGTANFSGLTQTAGLTQVDGVLNLVNAPLALKGGVLDGSGTINGNVVNTNGIVSPGDSPGTLTINGNYTQGSTGTLNIEFTNSLHDLLNVSGIATTGGILDVNYIDTSAFTGLVGSQFAFLDYGTLVPGTGANFGFTVTGHNGFTYTVVNDASNKMLDLRVAMIGSPAPAVPEASTTVSLGLLLLLGLGGTVVAAKRKKSA